MPTLKQITCSIELGSGGTKLTEYGHRYSDGGVECFVPVPDERIPFCIHVTSDGYIAPRLLVRVFIDGFYQCNRHRGGLKMPGEGISESATGVDLYLRQKEEKTSQSTYIVREWTFTELNRAHVGDLSPRQNERFNGNVGTIEVLVYRCKDDESNTLTPKASGAELVKRQSKAIPVTKSRRASKLPSEASGGSLFGGMFGVLDGANDEDDVFTGPGGVFPGGVNPLGGDGHIRQGPPPGYKWGPYYGQYGVMLDDSNRSHNRGASGRGERHNQAGPNVYSDNLWTGHPPDHALTPTQKVHTLPDDDASPEDHGAAPQVIMNQWGERGRDDDRGDPYFGAEGEHRRNARQGRREMGHQVTDSLDGNGYDDAQHDFRNAPHQNFYQPRYNLHQDHRHPAYNQALPHRGPSAFAFGAQAQPYGHVPQAQMYPQNELQELYRELEQVNDEINQLGRKHEQSRLQTPNQAQAMEYKFRMDMQAAGIKKQNIVNRIDFVQHQAPQPDVFGAGHMFAAQAQYGGMPREDAFPGGGAQVLGQGDPQGFGHFGGIAQDIGNPEARQGAARSWPSPHHTGPPNADNDENAKDAWLAAAEKVRNAPKRNGGWDGGNDGNWHGICQQKSRSKGSQAHNDWASKTDGGQKTDAANRWNSTPSKKKDDAGNGWHIQDNQNNNAPSKWGNGEFWDRNNNNASTPADNRGEWTSNIQPNMKPASSPPTHTSKEAPFTPQIKPYWADCGKSAQEVTPNTNTKKKPQDARPVYEFPATPMPVVPVNIANELSHGVQVGPGAEYAHRSHRPLRIDPDDKPYAVFSFKYRSKGYIEQNLKVNASADLETVLKQAQKDLLLSTPKHKLVDELMKVKTPRKAIQNAPMTANPGKQKNSWDNFASNGKAAADAWGTPAPNATANDWGRGEPALDKQSAERNSSQRTPKAGGQSAGGRKHDAGPSGNGGGHGWGGVDGASNGDVRGGGRTAHNSPSQQGGWYERASPQFQPLQKRVTIKEPNHRDSMRQGEHHLERDFAAANAHGYGVGNANQGFVPQAQGVTGGRQARSPWGNQGVGDKHPHKDDQGNVDAAWW